MKNKSIYVIVFLLFISSCSVNNVEKKIGQTVENCESENCVIAIATLTNFKWDKMYVFNNMESPETIDHAIGTEYPYWEEQTRPMIFFYKNKIVHYENNDSNIEGGKDGQVIFKYADSLTYKVYTPEEAVFKGKTETFSKGVYYKLYPLKEDQ